MSNPVNNAPGQAVANTKPPVGDIKTPADVPSQPDVDPEEMKRLQVQLGKGNKKTETKFLLNQKNQKLTLTPEALKRNMTLYLKGCSDSEYVVDARCTKVLIESCNNVKVLFNAIITTSVAEVWKCQNIDLSMNTKLETLQLDLCRNVVADFRRRDMIHQVVWAGVHDLTVSIPDGSGGKETVVSGVPQMKEVYPDLQEDTDQFMIRIVETKLTSEALMRLENGFPTTEREAKAFEEREQRNKKIAEKHLKKLVKTAEIKHSPKVKVGRNDACTCGSGQKFKKCCGKNA
jgi:hypothetical protein